MRQDNNLWRLFRVLVEETEFPEKYDRIIEIIKRGNEEKQDED